MESWLHNVLKMSKNYFRICCVCMLACVCLFVLIRGQSYRLCLFIHKDFPMLFKTFPTENEKKTQSH